jgi:Protein of unknown function (DUF669)
MTQTFNLKGTKSSNNVGFEPIPDGVYPAKVIGSELATAQSSGNPMIKITLQITSGDFAKRLIWDNLVWTESSVWKIKSISEAAQIPSNTSDKATIEEVASELLDTHVDILVETKTQNNGSQQNVVKRYIQQEVTAPQAPQTAKKPVYLR